MTNPLRAPAEELVKKLELIIPKVDGYIGLHFFRTGQQYDGPSLAEELASLKAALSLPEEDGPEMAWLIEKMIDGQPHWLMAAWEFDWVSESTEAIRFARREDAEQIATMMENEDIKITEHMWIDSLPSPPNPQTKETV